MLGGYLQGLARDAIERAGWDGLLSLAVDPELALGNSTLSIKPRMLVGAGDWLAFRSQVSRVLWCDPEQPIETLPRFIRQAGRERPMQQPFAACTGSMAKNVDCSRCRQQDVSRSRLR